MAAPGAKPPGGMQFCRPGRPEDPVPGLGTKAHHTGKLAFQVPKFHRAQQPGEICTKRAQGSAILNPRVEGHDEEDRGTGERRGDWLREGWQTSYGLGCAGRIGFHRLWFSRRPRNLSPKIS